MQMQGDFGVALGGLDFERLDGSRLHVQRLGEILVHTPRLPKTKTGYPHLLVGFVDGHLEFAPQETMQQAGGASFTVYATEHTIRKNRKPITVLWLLFAPKLRRKS